MDGWTLSRFRMFHVPLRSIMGLSFTVWPFAVLREVIVLTVLSCAMFESELLFPR